MTLKGSLLGPTEMKEDRLVGCSGLVYTSQPGPAVLEESAGQMVWSLKESTAGGGG